MCARRDPTTKNRDPPSFQHLAHQNRPPNFRTPRVFRGGISEKKRKAFLFNNVVDSKGRQFDIPGVVGKVGTALGSYNINIGEFILSRKGPQDLAYSIIKIDGQISSKILSKIEELDEIVEIKQISIDG